MLQLTGIIRMLLILFFILQNTIFIGFPQNIWTAWIEICFLQQAGSLMM